MKRYLAIIVLLTAAIAGKAEPLSLDMSKASIISTTQSSVFDITIFKFLYPSIDGDGKETILSGLSVFPYKTSSTTGRQILPQNMIIGCHVTITDDSERPSNFGALLYPLNEVYALNYFAEGNDDMTNVLQNNLLVMPDYMGYGETKDSIHPYLIEELTARNVVDGARYGKALMETLTYVEDGNTKNYQMDGDGWKTVICGYSQGAAAALATDRFIEENGYSEDMHLLGCVCGDGPYSEQITMNSYAEDGRLNMPAVAPLVLNGLINYDSLMRKHSVDEYLSPRFLQTGIMRWIQSKTMSLTDISDSLRKKGFVDHTIQAIFRSDIVDCMKGGSANEAYSDLQKAMAHNDLTTGWTPRHRMCLFHSSVDDVVSVNNCTAFMNNNYTGRDGLVKSVIDSIGTHSATGVKFFTDNVLQMIGWLYADAQTWYAAGDDYTPTSIQTIDGGNATYRQNHKIYDLYGRCVDASNLTKGIYIRDGRKFVVR
jgi:hypothetical protein